VPWPHAVTGPSPGLLSCHNPAPRGTPSVPSDAIGDEAQPTLYVCMSCCRQGTTLAPQEIPVDGRRLFDAVKALLAEMGEAAPARALPTLCFANCERGCSVAIGAPGKWSYLLGGLGPEHAADLLTYAVAYAKAKAGVVLPSGRPVSLQQAVIARFPGHLDAAYLDAMQLAAMKDAAE
jgi:predicted metal-binding protein